MNYLALLFSLLSLSARSDSLESLVQKKIIEGETFRYQLPPQKKEFSLALEELAANVRGETLSGSLATKGYSVEIKTSGDCSNSSSQNCQNTVIGRRFFRVFTSDIRNVVNTYTKDLRYPNDKNFKISGVLIQRHHWEITAQGAIKVESVPLPMDLGKEYILKKCRNGFMAKWKCNSIAYELNTLDEKIFILTGRQVTTKGEPLTYQEETCPPGKTLCTANFLDLQKRNSSDGILLFTVIRAESNSNIPLVTISEVNLSGVTRPDEARRLAKGESFLENNLEEEYKLLKSKMASLSEKREPASVASVDKTQLNRAEGKSARYFILMVAMALGLAIAFLSTSSGSAIKQSPSINLATPLVTSSALPFNEQEAFLQEVTDPVAHSQGMINIALEGLKKDSDRNSSEIAKLEKAVLALAKVSQAIEKNRSLMIKQNRSAS